MRDALNGLLVNAAEKLQSTFPSKEECCLGLRMFSCVLGTCRLCLNSFKPRSRTSRVRSFLFDSGCLLSILMVPTDLEFELVPGVRKSTRILIKSFLIL